MSDVAIRVENLSKQYRIGAPQARYKTLRESLVDMAAAPARRLRRLGQPSPENETIWALKDVSFDVKKGEVVGIIGRNGSGKTTLLKILSRITEPTEGYAEIKGRVGSLLEVGTGFHPELTGRENIYLNGAILGMKRTEIDEKFDEIVAFSEIEKFLDTPVKRYSSGMYVRLAFSVAAHLEPEILLVDEVLAVGDAAFQKKCLGKMGDVAKEGRTVLFVSHNMMAIAELCERAVTLDRGTVVAIEEPLTAVQRYLSSFAESTTAAGRTNLRERKDRDGEGPIRFVSFHCEREDSRASSHLVSGEPGRLVLTYESMAQTPPQNVFVSILIYTSLGQQIANVSNEYFHAFETMPSVGQIACEFARLSLRSGHYTASLWCSVDARVSDFVQQAAVFDVIDGDYYGTGRITNYYRGSVFLDHSWRVRPSGLQAEGT